VTVEVCHNMLALAKYALKPVAVYPRGPVPAQGVLYETVIVSRRHRNPKIGDGANYVCIYKRKTME
jgi:hypothetical protein